MRVARAGRARISARRPEALGECDICGEWRNHVDLSHKMEWAGNSLRDTGDLVCIECLDVPQDQYRNPILPRDPQPILNARISGNITPIPIVGQPLPTTPANLGFTQLYVGAASLGNLYPADSQADVLANIISMLGIATPANIASMVFPLTASVSSQIAVADTSRSFIAFYNPTNAPVQIALGGVAVQGAITNLSLGPNETFVSATAIGLGAAYQGSLAAISPYGAALPVWVFTDGAVFFNDGGVLYFPTSAAAVNSGYPIGDPSTTGRFYSNGLAVCISKPASVVPVPSAPLYFTSTYPATLGALNGAALPLSAPAGSGQLYSNGGLVCIA